MKILLTDIDGVLLNWAKGYSKFFDRPHKGGWLEPSDDEFDQFFGSNTFKELEAIGDSEIYLPKFHADGWTIIAISAAPMQDFVVSGRKENLKLHFGNIFAGVFHVDAHPGSKEHALRAFEPAIWVEDHIVNARIGSGLGHQTFLYTTPWNLEESDPMVTRVNSWKEIYDSTK